MDIENPKVDPPTTSITGEMLRDVFKRNISRKVVFDKLAPWKGWTFKERMGPIGKRLRVVVKKGWDVFHRSTNIFFYFL